MHVARRDDPVPGGGGPSHHKSIFTKRHYVRLAAYWHQQRARMDADTWATAVLNCVAMLKSENPQFLTGRFLQSCGLTRKQAYDMLEGKDV